MRLTEAEKNKAEFELYEAIITTTNQLFTELHANLSLAWLHQHDHNTLYPAHLTMVAQLCRGALHHVDAPDVTAEVGHWPEVNPGNVYQYVANMHKLISAAMVCLESPDYDYDNFVGSLTAVMVHAEAAAAQ